MADITQAAAIIGAVSGVVAAGTGIFNALYQYFTNKESIYVGFGSLRAHVLEADSLYVLNKSKFDVELKDYGFVTNNGELFSIPLYCETEIVTHDDGFYIKGEPIISTRSIFRVGLICPKPVVGAYAITAAQSIPTVQLYKDHPFWKRFIWKVKSKYLQRYC